MNGEWVTDKNPTESGYYIAAQDDNWTTKVTELWYSVESPWTGWWPTRSNINIRFRIPEVLGWMKFPEYPGPGKIVAYMHNDQVLDPEEVKIIREQVSL